MGDLSGLAPKPDPQTGHPRPPRAPLEPEWKRPEKKHQDGENKVPPAPPGEGPILEWFCPVRSFSLTLAAIMAVVMIVFFIIKDGGFGWVSVWWLWIFVFVPPLPFLLLGKNLRVSAGADWVSYGNKSFIKTYDLVKVKATVGGAARYLDLEDSHGNTLRTQLNDLQMNRELWDLVYNGILHSVRGNDAETNKLARAFLELDNPLRWRG